jgi:uncharacterized protein YndB with AHSA1/START domain
MSAEPIIIERTFNAPAEKVWQALTDPQIMQQWYFDLPDFKPQVGCEFRFWGGRDAEHQFQHICVVTEVLENRKLTHSWRYEGYAGISYVTFELFPEGEKTHLKFTHAGLETFPADIPDLARENFVEGWTSIVGALKGVVEA